MSKLFKLQEWLTLDESAVYLSETLNIKITPAEILKQAISGNLIISVYLVNKFFAYTGKVVTNNQPKGVITEILKNGDVIVVGEMVSSMSGIFDLPMIGGEVRDCEQKLQELVNGPVVTGGHPSGAYLRDFKTGDYYQILSYSSQKGETVPYWGVRDDFGKWGIKDRLFQKSFIAKYIEQGGDIKDLEAKPTNDDVFVVRTSALTDFVDLYSKQETYKPLATTERNTLLTIIAALVNDFDSKIIKNGNTATHIADLTHKLGASVSIRTIDEILKKIPSGIRSRLK